MRPNKLGPIIWADCDGTRTYKVIVEGNSLVQVYKKRTDGTEVIVGNFFVQEYSDVAVCVKVNFPEVQRVPEKVLVTTGGMTIGGKGHKRPYEDLTPDRETPEHEDD